MKYGVAVTIEQTGYIEVEAVCEAEARDKAREAVLEEHLTIPKVALCFLKSFIAKSSGIKN